MECKKHQVTDIKHKNIFTFEQDTLSYNNKIEKFEKKIEIMPKSRKTSDNTVKPT